MRFVETTISGAFIIEPEYLSDERGFFARTWCQKEFEAHHLETQLVQCNISFNKKRGTLRGMHYQISPYEEVKVVRCTRGVIYDVILDLRPESASFRQWVSIELSESNHRMFYIPKGLAHGFQTLTDNTEVVYQMSEFYYPDYARGIRWNDPLLKIEWPIDNPILSDRDKSFDLLGQELR